MLGTLLSFKKYIIVTYNLLFFIIMHGGGLFSYFKSILPFC